MGRRTRDLASVPPEPLPMPSNRRDWKERRPGTRAREKIESRKRNWEACRPEFWREEWRPTFDYRHSTDQISQMWQEVTEEEKDELTRQFRVYNGDSVLAATAVRIPASVASRVLKVHDDQSAMMISHKVRMGERTALGSLDRWKMVEEKLLLEVERRTNTTHMRKKMLPAELQQLLKTAATVIKFKEDTSRTGADMTMQVVTQLPMLSERGEAGFEEEEA